MIAGAAAVREVAFQEFTGLLAFAVEPLGKGGLFQSGAGVEVAVAFVGGGEEFGGLGETAGQQGDFALGVQRIGGLVEFGVFTQGAAGFVEASGVGQGVAEGVPEVAAGGLRFPGRAGGRRRPGRTGDRTLSSAS